VNLIHTRKKGNKLRNPGMLKLQFSGSER
jgi:hypothetical protein